MLEDGMAALREFVRDTVEITDLLGESVSDVPAAERVYVNRIPQDVIAGADTYHPPKIVVLRQAGGEVSADELPIETERVIVLCYGESQHEADRVRRAVAKAFKHMSRRKYGSVLLHHITRGGGPVPLHDPDIVWPAVSQTFNLTADLEDAA